MNEMELLQIRVKEMENILQAFVKSDRYTIQKDIEIFKERNIKFDTVVGTKVGTSALEKMGFYGVTPIIQGDFVDGPTGGATVDQPCRDKFNELRQAIIDLGLIATL